jgi:hypothetical protein
MTGTITIGAGASVTAGEIFVLSCDADKIAPEADLAASDYVSILGVGNASDGIDLGIQNTGTQVPA